MEPPARHGTGTTSTRVWRSARTGASRALPDRVRLGARRSAHGSEVRCRERLEPLLGDHPRRPVQPLRVGRSHDLRVGELGRRDGPGKRRCCCGTSAPTTRRRRRRRSAFFAETPKSELTALSLAVIDEPLAAAGIDREKLRQGTMWTRASKARVSRCLVVRQRARVGSAAPPDRAGAARRRVVEPSR